MKITIFLSFLLFGIALAKQFNECEVAKCLLKYGVTRANIPKVICSAKKTTGLKTDTQSEPEDGDRKHGLFSFDDIQWCKNGDKFSVNICDLTCDQLKDDDLENDCECVAMRQDRNRLDQLNGWNECQDTPKTIIGPDCIL